MIYCCVLLLMTPPQGIVFRSLYIGHVISGSLAVPAGSAPIDYVRPVEYMSCGMVHGGAG